MAQYLVIGNGPTALTTLPTVDKVVRFNAAPSLSVLPGRTDILCIAASWQHLGKLRDNLVKWSRVLAAKELWVTYQNESGRLLQELAKYIVLPPVTLELRSHETCSSGHQVVRHILKNQDNSCLLTGFTFQGWGGHPWQKEKEWTLEQAHHGRIEIIGSKTELVIGAEYQRRCRVFPPNRHNTHRKISKF